VEVTGLLQQSESKGRFRPEQRSDGRLIVGSVHVPGLRERLPYPVYPGFVQLQEPDDPGRFPAPLPEPDLGAGPHLSYALQWFAFSTIAVIGWVVLIRTSAMKRRRSLRPDPSPPGR
jgi:cytochrome oxidase assembly protein ShyY1